MNFCLTTEHCDGKRANVLGFMLSAKKSSNVSKITINESRRGGLRGTVISVILTTTWWSSSDPPIPVVRQKFKPFANLSTYHTTSLRYPTATRLCDSATERMQMSLALCCQQKNSNISKITINESRRGGLRGTVISVILTTTW